MIDEQESAAARMRGVMDADDGQGGELWNPEPGEYLVAEFLRSETRRSKKTNSDWEVAVVREVGTNTLWAVWLMREVLRSEFERKAPRAGDLVGIKYHGRKVNPDGSEGYHRYSLEVDRLGRPVPTETPKPPAAVSGDASDLEELPF